MRPNEVDTVHSFRARWSHQLDCWDNAHGHGNWDVTSHKTRTKHKARNRSDAEGAAAMRKRILLLNSGYRDIFPAFFATIPDVDYGESASCCY